MPIFELIRTNKSIMKFSFSILLIFLFFSSGIYSQSDVTQSATRAGQERYQDIPYFQRARIVNEKIAELKEGSLVVRLMAYESKIQYLQEHGRNEDAEKLASLIKSFNISIINEFKQDYDFSDVYFAYGKPLKQYMDKEENNVFLNEQLQADPNITMKDGPMFILAAQGTDKFYMYDEDWQRVPEPAPHAINFFDNKKGGASIDRFLEILAGNSAYIADVYYFNDKLFKIYRKASQKRDRRRRG